MNNNRVRASRYAAIKRQMQRVARDHDQGVQDARVERVLAALNSDSLISQAASGPASEDGLLIECNVAPLVWDDPRIAQRLHQLEGSGVDVALVDHEQEIAGKVFKRTKIRVSFQP